VKDVMNKFSKKINVVEVCTDDLPDVAAQAGVVSIPTIQIYCMGEKKDTIVGCVAKPVLANAVKKVLEDAGFASDED
jgi:thioredoxin 1